MLLDEFILAGEVQETSKQIILGYGAFLLKGLLRCVSDPPPLSPFATVRPVFCTNPSPLSHLIYRRMQDFDKLDQV
jgi:hypothetical protein